MKILLTRRAEKNFGSIKDYIKKEWGENTVVQFVQKADELFKLLSIYPEMGK